MKRFRVSGVFQRDFVIEIEAKSMDDACDLVGQFDLGDFDATSYAPTLINSCIPLNEAGEEEADGRAE